MAGWTVSALDCDDGIDEDRWERLCAEPIQPTTAQIIADSLRAVLAAHNLVVCRATDTNFQIDDTRLSALLREAGNNAAQVVLLMEEMDDE